MCRSCSRSSARRTRRRRHRGRQYRARQCGTANQYNSLGALNYTAQTGIGNANANADLAGLNASGNFWNMAA
jgi:hypothetical protein